MRILIVDDENLVLEDTKEVVEEVLKDHEINAVSSSREAIESTEFGKTCYDLAILDIEMPGINGIELAKLLIDRNPKCEVIFLTAYKDYAFDAYGVKASDYLLKPLTENSFRESIGHLRYFKLNDEPKKHNIKAVCFGKFTLYADGKLVHFKREKEAEVLAFILSARGEAVDVSAICDSVFGDDSDKNRSYFFKVLSELRKDLSEYGIENIISSSKGSYIIAADEISCDYFDYLDGKYDKAWNEEFLEQFGLWTEFKKAELFYLYR